MGFGFNLLFLFVLVPFTIVLLLTWLFSKKSIFGKLVVLIWCGIFSLVFLVSFFNWLISKKELTKEDYYGEYIVNRDYFPGKQADWQYNNFRFRILENDSIYFFVTDKERIISTFSGTISTTDPMKYKSERLKIYIQQPGHHILQSNPTTYRSAWGFYLVFYSQKFNNIYFKRGRWRSIDKL